MKKKIVILLTIASITISNPIYSLNGWRIVSNFTVIKDTIFDIKYEAFKQYDGHYFPAKNYPLNKDIFYAVEPLKKRKIKANTTSIYYKKEFENPTKVDLDSISVISRIYTKNISSYTITLTNSFNGKIKNYYNLFHDGYQDYEIEIPNKWIQNDSLFNLDNFKLKSIEIEAIPKSKKYKFAIGEFQVLKLSVLELDIVHPFFSFLERKEIRQKHYVGETKNDILLVEPFDPFDSWNKPTLKFVKDSLPASIPDEKDLLMKVYENTLDMYHFYEERGLDKRQIMNDFQTIKEDIFLDESIKLAKKLSEFTKQFNDGHFSVIVPKKNRTINKDSLSINNRGKVRSNIRLIKLNEKVHIASVFDSTLFDKKLLGKEVVKIDGKLIKTNEKLSKILDRPKGTNVLLHYRDDNLIDSITVKNNIQYPAPNNFKPKHCDFKVKDQIAYFRVNKFEQGVFLRIINHVEEINNSKGLIIDLRGNGGGETMASHRLFSLFINKPSVYSNLLDYLNERESVIVIPNGKFYIDIPVVILIDKNTACESEAFTEAMRFNIEAVVVGKDSSKGAYASVYSIEFPSGVKLKINTLDSIGFLCNNEIIEGKGITPDVIVKIINVYDLYPYQDKVLLTGIKMLAHIKN